MAELLGPKGKQVPDHSLEVADLPIVAEHTVLYSGASGEFFPVTMDSLFNSRFISKISDGVSSAEVVWSGEYLQAEFDKTLKTSQVDGGSAASGYTLDQEIIAGGA